MARTGELTNHLSGVGVDVAAVDPSMRVCVRARMACVCVCMRVLSHELAPIITAANCTRDYWVCETERGCPDAHPLSLSLFLSFSLRIYLLRPIRSTEISFIQCGNPLTQRVSLNERILLDRFDRSTVCVLSLREGWQRSIGLRGFAIVEKWTNSSSR